MQRITAIIRIEKLDDVRAALETKGYPGLTISRIEGHGRQKGLTQQFRGREYSIDLLPKVQIDIVAKEQDIEKIVGAIMDTAKTGDTGDGKIFVSPVSKVYRIRTGESGEAAI